ncbi:MAG: MBL fold metallo-hydrolase [Waterburya sp.]
MKRRQLIRYGGISLISAIATSTIFHSSAAAQDNDGVVVQYLGHTCFLFTGSGLKVLVNPYKSQGCTAGYTLPDVQPDVVLVSSFLLDEGAIDAVKGSPQVITERGSHQFKGIKFQGFSLPHDREGGRRFGNNIAWRWTQGGVSIVHLGGAAAPLTTEDKILLNGADILLVPVGGGVKAYNPQEAKQAVDVLNPKMVIPTQYRTAASKSDACDLAPVDEFLSLVKDLEVAQVGRDRFEVKKSYLTSDRTLVRVLDY